MVNEGVTRETPASQSSHDGNSHKTPLTPNLGLSYEARLAARIFIKDEFITNSQHPKVIDTDMLIK